MAYVIDDKSIRITDRNLASYYIALDSISCMCFKKDALSIYMGGHAIRFDGGDFISMDEVRRIYYSLLGRLSRSASVGEPVATNTTYGVIPSPTITRSLAMARGNSTPKEDRVKKEEKQTNILRMSKTDKRNP